MDSLDTQLEAVRVAVTPRVYAALEGLLREGTDAEVSRVNALAFARDRQLPEHEVVAAFLHASRHGLVEMVWAITCPGCGWLLDAGQSAKALRQDVFNCAVCNADFETTLDRAVEVTFTVNRRVRQVPVHDPDRIS